MNIKTSAISLLTALVIMLTGCAKTEDPSQGSSDSSSAVTESAQGGEDVPLPATAHRRGIPQIPQQRAHRRTT